MGRMVEEGMEQNSDLRNAERVWLFVETEARFSLSLGHSENLAIPPIPSP